MRTLALLLSLLALLPAFPASGDQPPGADAGDTAAEGSVLERALARFEADDLVGAVELLEVAREEGKAGPQELSALGAFYLEIGLPDDALEVLGPLADRDDANPAVLYNAGRAAVEVGEGERGEEYLKRSVELQPVSPAARLLGLRLGARGQTPLSYRLLRPWALANPGDVEARQAAALGALQLGRVAEAEELVEGLPPDDPRSRILGADLALKKREPATAVELLEPLAGTAPPEMATDVLFLLSAAHLELGRSAAAVELLRGKVDGRPRLALNLARALHLGGDAAAALEVLGPYAEPVRTTDVDALPPGATRSLAASIVLEEGRLRLETEQPEAAVASLFRATELDPWSREGWQELARAHAATGDREAAERALERFRDLAEAKERAEVPGLAGRRRLTDATGGRLAEAVEWAERGEAEKALTVIRQEISLAPDDPRPRLLEIRTLLAERRVEEARGAAEEVVERFPDQPDARHFRAVVALADGDLETAEAELRRALELAPDHLPAKNDLALLLARRGDADAARELLREILADHPDDPLARQRLQALEEGSDN